MEEELSIRHDCYEVKGRPFVEKIFEDNNGGKELRDELNYYNLRNPHA